jgi:hypothetical protein
MTQTTYYYTTTNSHSTRSRRTLYYSYRVGRVLLVMSTAAARKIDLEFLFVDRVVVRDGTST